MTPQLKAVLRTYLRRPLIWFGMLMCVCQIAGVLEAVSSSRIAPQVLMMVAFGCGWPSAVIGFHVKQQFADARSALVPGFRAPHLVALISALCLLTLPVPLVAWAHGHSFVGMAAVCGGYCALALSWAILQRGPWSALLIIGVFTPYTETARQFFAELANGQRDGLSVVLLAVCLAVLVMVLRRLVSMTEEDPAYRLQFQTNVWDLNARSARRTAAAYYSDIDSRRGIAAWLTGTDLPERVAYVGDSRRARMRHWFAGWPNRRGLLVWAVPLWLLMIWWMRSDWAVQPRNVLMGQFWLFTALPQAMLLGFFQFRASMLGWESLRPLTREEFVQELGFAALACALLTWGMAFLALMTGVALTGFRAVGVQPLLVFGLVTGSLQFPAFAVTSRILATRRLWAAYVWLIGLAALGVLPVFVAVRADGMWLGLGLAAAFLLAGAVLLKRSYRFWCAVDLP